MRSWRFTSHTHTNLNTPNPLRTNVEASNKAPQAPTNLHPYNHDPSTVLRALEADNSAIEAQLYDMQSDMKVQRTAHPCSTRLMHTTIARHYRPPPTPTTTARQHHTPVAQRNVS